MFSNLFPNITQAVITNIESNKQELAKKLDHPKNMINYMHF